MKKSLVYTRTGDGGQTSLVGGERVSKTDVRLEAYGTVDELSAQLGLLNTLIPADDADHSLILFVQNKLFAVGSYLATDPSFTSFRQASLLSEEAIERIEHRIDAIDAELPKINNFVLPGGSPAAAQAHVARTVCRRAERLILRVAADHEVDDKILRFVNRLSDYLFVLSRKCNISAFEPELFWDKDC